MDNTQDMIISAILLTGAGLVLAVYFYNLTIRSIRKYSALMQNQKKYEEKMKEKEEMQARGEYHEWVTIPIGAQEVMVCKKTGYCPSRNSFFDVKGVQRIVAEQELAKRYEVHREEKIKLLASMYGLSIEDLENLADELFTMKKDFYVKHMTQELDKMKSQANEKTKED